MEGCAILTGIFTAAPSQESNRCLEDALGLDHSILENESGLYVQAGGLRIHMLAFFRDMTAFHFKHRATVRRLLVSIAGMMSILTIKSPTELIAQEGFLRGSSKTVFQDFDGKRESRLMNFVFACDRDCCLTGTYDDSKEEYILANKGNSVGISIRLDKRRVDEALKLEGKWSVRHLLQQRNLKLDDTFDSRYQATEFMSNMPISLPVYLSWHRVGVSKDVFLDALRGVNYRGTNELGSLEILGTNGIEKIVLRKSGSDLHSPGWVPLSKISMPGIPNGLKSTVEEYSFTPERVFGEHEPFRCVGTIVETDPENRSRKTEIEIQVTEYADVRAARSFINAFLAKVPNTKQIISSSEITTVLDGGKQKVALDRDVERVDEAQFSNGSPSFYYFAIVLFFLVVFGLIGYLRWAQKGS
jgi:hypothetical protein